MKMQEIDNFKKIFQYAPIENSVSISFDELGANVRIHHLNVISDGSNLASFTEDCSKMGDKLFKKTSYCTRNADGIVLFENKAGKSMVLCELKSSSRGVFNKAYQQVLSTYIKMCMMLSICAEFDITKYKVFFIFTAQEDAELAVLRNELEQIDESMRSFYDDVKLRLLKGEKVKSTLNELSHDLSFLHPSLINKEVVCQLLTSVSDTIDLQISSLTI